VDIRGTLVPKVGIKLFLPLQKIILINQEIFLLLHYEYNTEKYL